MTGHERSGWRDDDISLRHRCWGGLPQQDIDALVVGVGEQLSIFDHVWLEYGENHEPACLAELKAENTPRDHHQDLALIALAERAQLPAFLIRYWKAPQPAQAWHFYVFPLNQLAKEWVAGGLEMGEADLVWLLYKIRGRTPPDQVIRWLDGLVDPYDPDDPGRPF